MTKWITKFYGNSKFVFFYISKKTLDIYCQQIKRMRTVLITNWFKLENNLFGYSKPDFNCGLYYSRSKKRDNFITKRNHKLLIHRIDNF